MVARQPGTAAEPADSWWSVVIPFVNVIAVFCLICGTPPLVRYLAALESIDAYQHAAPCVAASATTQNCYTTTTVWMRSASYHPGSHGRGSMAVLFIGGTEADHWQVWLSGPTRSTEVAVPGGAGLAPTLQPSVTYVTTYRGRVIQLDVGGVSVRTSDYPGVFAYQDRVFATIFLAIGFPLLIFGLGLRGWVRRARSRPDAEQVLAAGRNVFVLAFRIVVGLSAVVVVGGILLLARLSGLI